MNTISFLLNLLYPPKCLACGELLWPHATVLLCDRCHGEWDKQKASLCRQCKRPHNECRCMSPILRDMKADVCHIVPYHSATVAGKLLLLAKDERLPVLTDFFARELADVVAARIGRIDRSRLVVTYLPRGRRRAAVCGVDQGRAIARALAKELGLPIVAVFRRCNSVAQKENDTAEQRLRAARRSYRLKKRLPDLQEKAVILVDDIFTSGATMIAGAELLRSRGAQEIFCVTVGKSEKTPNTQPK